VIAPGPAGNPFSARGMWVWVLQASDGGRISTLIARAQAYGIQTVLIKSADGIQYWPQFSASTVSALHRGGLHVCAWQFVYGIHPVQEARLGAEAVRDGADCLVIDAETQYQGKYVQAQEYLTTLRALIGTRFPVGLAGLPYVDYHPSFPYSVFLGPGGAQVNLPQMYWLDIGTTVAGVYAHTYKFNRLYERPIDPLGQAYGSPPGVQVRQFRAAASHLGAAGVSWWDWQAAGPSQFQAIGQSLGTLSSPHITTTVAAIRRGARGDLVVWAQEHLFAAGQRIAIDGDFGPQTQSAVARFQLRHGLPQTGVVTPATWAALLRYAAPAVTWVAGKGATPGTPGSTVTTPTTPSRTTPTTPSRTTPTTPSRTTPTTPSGTTPTTPTGTTPTTATTPTTPTVPTTPATTTTSTGPATATALGSVSPAPIASKRHSNRVARRLVIPVPVTARMPSRRNELGGSPGQGSP
jgi:peptidoglycan hydrolase-like protein with peptidoglycan-binding domain